MKNSEDLEYWQSIKNDERLTLVFLDLSIKKQHVGRVEIVLFSDTSPLASENFRQLCTGEKDKTHSLKKARFYEIQHNYLLQFGVMTDSVYGGEFEDDIFGLQMPFDRSGILTMINNGADTNTAHFAFIMAPSPHLTGKYPVFGQVVDGFETLDAINKLAEKQPDESADASTSVRIKNAGELRRGHLAPWIDAAEAKGTMSFKVCNGFANQRLSLLYGMILAKETKRTTFLPELIADGMQMELKDVMADDGNAVSFGSFYAEHHFRAHLAAVGVKIFSEEQSPDVTDETKSLAIAQEETEEVGFSQKALDYSHLEFQCPILQVQSKYIEKHRHFVEHFFTSLRPTRKFERIVKEGFKQLGGHFNFLHLRIEKDWIRHCKVWQHQTGPDNCLSNTLSVHTHIKHKGFTVDVPLYVASDWRSVDPSIADHVLKKLEIAGYHIITQDELFGHLTLSREHFALIEYYIGLQADKFIGNSVSTFSAMLMLERELKGSWSSYYNMGRIPLAHFIPLYKMPWVFTFNGNSLGYHYMLKAAVKSAIDVGNLTPYCIYSGDITDGIYQWLQSRGVTIIIHEPPWRPLLERNYKTAKAMAHTATTYSSMSSMFGTFQRFDIPVIKELFEFNYILFSDADVFFMQKITFESFGVQLPKSLFMAHDLVDTFPCNAGVVLMNLPSLRVSQDKLVNFTFSNPTLHYGEFGPADQGALNQFYQEDMEKRCDLSEEFNTKPYVNGNLRTPRLVHFHGPKPHHYLDYMATGKCGPFKKELEHLCEDGLKFMCRHAEYFTRYGEMDDVFTKLRDACIGR